MKLIKHYFEKFFEIPFPKELEFDGKLVPIRWRQFDAQPEMDPNEALLLASEIGSSDNLFWAFGGQLEKLLVQPEGFYLIGMFEFSHTNYFYYCRVDTWRKIYFSVCYGKYYGSFDNIGGDQERFREFLPQYLDFEEKLRGNVKELILQEDVRENYYKITLAMGETFYRTNRADRGSRARPEYGLIRNPDFEGAFGEVFEALERTSS